MRRIIQSLLPLVAAATFVNAAATTDHKVTDDFNAGIIYGEGHAFAASAPLGWVLDNESGAKEGLHAVFYPVGLSWSGAPVVMYVNTAKRSAGETLDSFIASDLSRLKLNSPTIQIATAPAIETSDKKLATVRHFTGDKWGNYEVVAYIQEDAMFVLLALSAHTKESYETSIQAFEALVKSYAFLTKDVQLNK